MELRHLRYFIAVADHLNFRKAAESLNVSQTAITVQIQDLEDELGIRLLDRDTRGVSGLTPPGTVFAKEARAILKQADAAVQLMKETGQGKFGRLVIGNVAALSAGFMSPTLERFRTLFPDVDVSLVALGMIDHPRALEDREIDVGFTMGPRDPLPKTIQSRVVLNSPLRVIVGPNHPLAKARRISLAQLSQDVGYGLAYQKAPSLQLQQIGQIFASHDVPLGRTKTMDSLDGMVAMLLTGTGFTIFPEITSKILPKEMRLKPTVESFDPRFTELSVLWRVNETSPIVRNFLFVLPQP